MVRWLERQKKVPYSQYSNLKQAQGILEGSYFMEHYIEGFEYINLEHEWVFNDYGLFPFKDMKNREETDAFLEEQMKMPLSVYWQNRMEVNPPLKNNLRMSNTVDSSGLLLVVKKEKGISGLVELSSRLLEQNIKKRKRYHVYRYGE